jgi:Ni/Co efflux regulator RcnB
LPTEGKSVILVVMKKLALALVSLSLAAAPVLACPHMDAEQKEETTAPKTAEADKSAPKATEKKADKAPEKTAEKKDAPKTEKKADKVSSR